MKDRARKLLKEYDVRGGDPDTLASALSGGNQQKVAVAREIASNPKLLIAHQPTRGLDVGAIEFVHGRLLAEREEGRGVLLVSLEFEEIRALADRILVIYEGQDRRRVPARRVRGGARRGDDGRRRPRAGGRVSATPEPRRGSRRDPARRGSPPTCAAAAWSCRCSRRCSPSSSAGS